MRFRRRLKANATPDLIPMIDVVFQLVIFFMVSSTFVMTPAISLDLPESGAAEQVAMTQLVITVAGDDEVYLNDERYDMQQLNEELAAIAAAEEGEQQRRIVVEGDRNVRYDAMVGVLDALRRNGFRGASLRTREPLED